LLLVSLQIEREKRKIWAHTFKDIVVYSIEICKLKSHPPVSGYHDLHVGCNEEGRQLKEIGREETGHPQIFQINIDQ
jgi:hypothetical protein